MLEGDSTVYWELKEQGEYSGITKYRSPHKDPRWELEIYPSCYFIPAFSLVLLFDLETIHDAFLIVVLRVEVLKELYGVRDAVFSRCP